MYSAARSKIFGIVHSPLVELSGVGGGSDPIPETGGINPPIAVVVPAFGFRYAVAAAVVGVPVASAYRPGPPWLANAASSFSSARRVFVRGLAHCVCVSAATVTGTGEVALRAPGLVAAVLVVPGMVLKTVLRSGCCIGVVPGIGDVMGLPPAAAVAAAAAEGSPDS